MEPKSFLVDGKTAWSMLWTVSSKALSQSAPEGDTLSIFQGWLQYKHPWKYSPRQREPIPCS